MTGAANKKMRMARYKTIIVGLLILVFTGQGLASAKTSCLNQLSPSSEHSEQVVSDSVDHSQHRGLDAYLPDETAALDCCPDCDCNLGGCTATAVLPSAQSLSMSYSVSLRPRDNQLASKRLAATFFRPPIFR
jgi:hypothetical protein